MFEDPDRIANAAYLGLLLAAIGGYTFVSHRKSLGKMAQYAAIWGFIFLGAIVAAFLWQDLQNDLLPRQSVVAAGTIEVPRSADGHFYLMLDVNGTPTRFVVDTGATDIVLTTRDAAAAGIDIDSLIFSGRAATANGEVQTAPVWLDTLALEDTLDTGIRAVVNRGEMPESLLGMSYLNRFSRLEIANGRLVLQR
ncbi:TIGR02281 family clan AA aspartic protease [Gymnodinialimonas sp. 2305UL16-5]|uniref:retropepsin-like aspartic protease family protein n=1 Tax=Gymnodinialimonas mytili TaxID=3126503 RepID=UPI0030A8E772